MTSILFLLPISIGLSLLALFAFFWSMKTHQYRNMESDAYRVLTSENVPMDAAEREALRDIDRNV